MAELKQRPVIFGEVLFDCFPDGSQVLGGAPFNVAWHLRGFGEDPLLISRVGDDPSGELVKAGMAEWGMDLAGVQTDPLHETGSVRIELVDGEPQFHILPNQAYDHIELARAQHPGGAAFLYHGSLALRHQASRASLDALVQHLQAPVFLDVNLRSPWWAAADVMRWSARANWLKLNQDELEILSPGDADVELQALRLLAHYGLAALILTQGAAGATVFAKDGDSARVKPGRNNQMVDAVGAGDAFSSVFLLGQLRGWPLPIILQRAQDFASAIVGVRGATVKDASFYQRFLELWSRS